MNSKSDHLLLQQKPFYGLPLHYWLSYRLTWIFLWFVGLVLFRHRNNSEIFDQVSNDQSFLLLPNHSSILDPFWVAHPPYRPVRFMTSAHVMNIPILGSYLRTLGSFPKQKFAKDKSAMKTLQHFYDCGYPITLFPEGRRTWNGRLEPILPGIGRLIKRLRSPVIYARMNTSYLFQPRWATYPRWVPIEITYDGPYEYSENTTVEAITADVEEKLRCNSKITTKAWTFGWRMAHGLPEYLWACPSCFTIESMTVSKKSGNNICCTACSAEWRVDVHTNLHGTSETTVENAFNKISEKFGSPPVVDQKEFKSNGIALSRASIEIKYKTERGFVTMGKGRLRIKSNGLYFTYGSQEWHAPFSAVSAISMELSNRLIFKVNGTYHEIATKGSKFIWAHFIRKWKHHLTGSEY